jgi:ribosome-associated toxin RatA of RatAB toxin-antitoxin module
MHMRNEILIAAPPERIFSHASATDRWPQILPHYRYVRVLSADGDRRVVEMAAKRPLDAVGIGIPVRWRAEQINDASLPQISFRHIAGWTKGMLVYWYFTAENGKTRVQIDHEWRSPLAPFIGKYFIDPIATRTLARIKEICECS